MNNTLLNQMSDTTKEISDLEERIQKYKSKQSKVVVDAVKGSSKEYPYTQHSCKIEGIETPRYKRLINSYRKTLQQKKEKLIKLNKQFEYELNNVKDTELRMMLRYKFVDNMKNYQIAQKMSDKFEGKDYTEDSIRMKLNRYLKKN